MAKVNIKAMVDRAIERNIRDGRLSVMQIKQAPAPTETKSDTVSYFSPLPTCNGSPCTEADHSIIIKRVNGQWQSTPYCKATKVPCTHPEHIKSIWYEHTTKPDMDGFRAAFNEYTKTLSGNTLYIVGLETRYPEIYMQTKRAHEAKDTAHADRDLAAYKLALDTLIVLYTKAFVLG